MAKAIKKKTVSKKTSTSKTKKASAGKASARPSRAKATSVDRLPALTLPATGGRSVALSQLKGNFVVLYFYPKDSTPGCTLEGRDFSRLYDSFRRLGAEVFGVSRDSLKSHENFKAKEGYCMDLLSDADEKLCQALGVIKMKNMYGRQVRGIERSTFLVDRDGRLVKEWRGVKVPNHAEEVLEFLRSLT